jgi:hypothetical protein
MLFVVRPFHILISCETGQPSETKLDRNRPWKEEIFFGIFKDLPKFPLLALQHGVST